MEICTRIPPPPIPPWLLDKTTEFHRRVANCSSWTKYAEFCPVQVASEYLQTILDADGTGTAVSQWIAFITTCTLVACIVISVCLLYFLHANNRMTLTCLLDCHKHICNSCTSRKKRFIAISVSEMTQLAMEKDQFLVITSPSATIHELVKRTSRTRRKTPPSAFCSPLLSQGHTSGEIMLLPERLMEDNMQSSPCTASLSEREYCSNHSLPFDFDCHKGIMKQSKTFASSFGLDEEQHDNPVIHTGQVKAPKINNSLHKHLGYSKYITMAEARQVVQRCKNAGVSLSHRVHLWHRSTHRWSASHHFVKLRQSLSKVRRSRRQTQTAFKSAQTSKLIYGSYPSTSSEIWSEQLATSTQTSCID